MSALHHSTKPASTLPGSRRCRVNRGCSGERVGSHQQATLLSQYFRSANWCSCTPGPTLLAAAAICRRAQNPAAQWDVWFFSRDGTADAPTTHRTHVRRARLQAGASAAASGQPGAAWIMVLEERTAPATNRPARRLVVELATEPFAHDPVLAPVDARVVLSITEMLTREAGRQNPQPDLTVDLEALGLIAPRAESW